jgi:hypothetical protein
MEYQQLKFSAHALQQLFQRDIMAAEIEEVVRQGTIVAEYPDDTPYPSKLLLGIIAGKAIHAVAAEDGKGTCIVVTAYEPSLELWEKDFRTRRKTL